MAATRLIEALRSQMRRRLKLDIVNVRSTPTLRHRLEQVLRAYRIDTVLDVGANEGQFAGRVRDLGFTDTIHSFGRPATPLPICNTGQAETPAGTATTWCSAASRAA